MCYSNLSNRSYFMLEQSEGCLFDYFVVLKGILKGVLKGGWLLVIRFVLNPRNKSNQPPVLMSEVGCSMCSCAGHGWELLVVFMSRDGLVAICCAHICERYRWGKMVELFVVLVSGV